MRRLLTIAFVLNVVLVLISCLVLPDTVAIHFGRGGFPDSWASKEFNAFLFVIIDIILFIIFLYGPRLKLGLSEKNLSLPNKNYWLKADNKEKLKSILIQYMNQFGVAMFSFMFGVGVFVIDANLSNPVRLNEPLFLVLLIVFMLYVTSWTIKLVLALRIPKI